MKFKMNKIKGIFIVLMLFSFASLVVAYSAEEQDAIDILNNFYDASVVGDVDLYLSYQDSYFLNQMSEESGVDLNEFYTYAFEEVKTSEVMLTNIEVSIEGDTAIVYYELEGNYETKEGELGSIENDMVAFLWKYEDWKVRWTITRSLYEEKIGMAYAMDVVIENIFEEMNEAGLKEELIAEGFNVSVENYEIMEETRSYWFFYVIVILLGLFLVYKFRSHELVGKANVKMRSLSNKIVPIAKNLVEDGKKKSKELHKKAKPKMEKIVSEGKKHSVNLYDNVKPHVLKVSKNSKKISIELYGKLKTKFKKK